MCFTNKYRKNKQKLKQQKLKKNKIQPIQIKTDPEKTILDELIFCEGCKKHHRSDDFILNCASCDKFFHCKVAGRCIGKNCTFGTDGRIYRLGYCLNCVDLKITINSDSSMNCLCKNCQNVNV
jgi:hypothetical protein